jgi:hypothetical protein
MFPKTTLSKVSNLTELISWDVRRRTTAPVVDVDGAVVVGGEEV